MAYFGTKAPPNGAVTLLLQESLRILRTEVLLLKQNIWRLGTQEIFKTSAFLLRLSGLLGSIQVPKIIFNHLHLGRKILDPSPFRHCGGAYLPRFSIAVPKHVELLRLKHGGEVSPVVSGAEGHPEVSADGPGKAVREMSYVPMPRSTVGLVGKNLQETIALPVFKMGPSCKCSHQPIQ